MNKLGLIALVGERRLENLFEPFSELTGVPFCLTDSNGNKLLSSGWKKQLEKMRSIDISFEDILQNKRSFSNIREMININSDISINGNVIGNLKLGQFFFDEQKLDPDYFCSNAAELGIDERECRDLFSNVPYFSKEKIKAVLKYVSDIISIITELAYKNRQINKDYNELEYVKEELSAERRRFLDMLDSSIDILYRINPQEMRFDYVSPSVKNVLGYSVDEIYSMGVEGFKNIVHKDDQYILEGHLRTSRTEKAVIDVVNELKYRIRTNQDNYKTILDKSKLIKAGPSNSKYLIGSLRDITRETSREKELAYKLQFEKIITKITSTLIHTDIEMIDEEIRNSLEKIGKFTDAGRCYLYSIEKKYNKVRKIFEWRNKNILPSANSLELSFRDMPMLARILTNGHQVNISDIDETPDEYSRDRETLKNMGVKSIAVVPLQYGKNILGLLGMSAIENKIEWKDEIFNLLEVIGQVFVNALIRKETAREMKSKSMILEKIAGLAPFYIFIYDIEQNNIIWSNKDIFDDLGYSQEDKQNMDTTDWTGIIHPDDLESLYTESSDANIFVNDIEHREARMFASDGSMRYFYIRSVVFRRSDDGSVKEILGTAIDVTSQKTVEKELEERERQYRSLIETMNEGFAVIDRDEKHIFVNKKFCDMTGYSKEEIIDKPLSLILDEENIDLVRKQRNKRETGKETPYEITINRKDGSKVDVLSSPRNVINSKGKVIGSFGVFTDLTELKMIERELEASSEKYRNLYEKTPVMLHSINKKAEILNVSDHWLKKLGYTRDEVIGRSITEFMTPRSAEYAKNIAIPKFFRSGELKHLPYQFVKKDGSEIDVLLSAIAEWDSKGGIIRSLALMEDITERKEIENKLIRSEEKYRVLVETSKDPILIINGERKITDSNKAASDFFGYDSETLRSRIFDDLIEEHLNLDNLFLNEDFIEKGMIAETFAVISNGRHVPIEINARRLFEESSSSKIVIYVHDISTYKSVENKLNKLLEAEKGLSYCIQTLLEDNNDALDKVLEHIVYLTDIDQISIYENFIDPIDGVCLRMINNASIDKNKINIRQFSHIPYERDYIRWEQIMLDKKIIIDDVDNLPRPERKMLKMQGIGSIIAIPIHIAEKWYGFVSFAKIEGNGTIVKKDITFLKTFTEMIGIYLDRKNAEFERKKLIAKLKISNERIENNAVQLNEMNKRIAASEEKLKRSNTSKDKFFSIIAHDLKTPITGFHGMTKLLYEEKDKMSKEEMDEFTEMLFSSSQQVTKLLDNLLQWSRIQRGVLEYNEEQFQLDLVVKFIADLFQPNIQAKRIELINKIDEEIWVKADNNAVNTTLRNLISNAIKFTNFGGKITIDAKEMEDFFAISVTDTGVGMEKDDMNKIFKIDKHHSTTGTNNETGTGLGLILCKDLVNLCGGEITVDSTPGVGTTFTFTLKKADLTNDEK